MCGPFTALPRTQHPSEWPWLQSSSGNKGNGFGTLTTLAGERQWEDLARVDAGQGQRPGCPRASWDLDMVYEPRVSKGQPSALELWRQSPWAQITALPLACCRALGSSADHLAALCLSFPICHMKIIIVPTPHRAVVQSKRTHMSLKD